MVVICGPQRRGFRKASAQGCSKQANDGRKTRPVVSDADMKSISLLRTLAADGERWRSLIRPLVAVLVASQRPVSISRARQLLKDELPFDQPAVVEALERDLGSWVTVFGADGDRRYLLRSEELRDLVIRQRGDLPDLLGEEFVNLNRRLVRRLLPPDASGNPDWASIGEYAAHSLPGYAFAGEDLERMMTDPDFVLACAPQSLLCYANFLRESDARKIAVAVECAFSHSKNQSWWFYVWALKAGANALAVAIAERHPEWTVKIRFTLWHGIPSHALRDISAMACIAAFRDRDGRHLLALETDAGTIRIWDPAARSLVGDGIRVSGEWIRSLAVMPTRERGDVLVVNVDTRPYPQQSESMPDEDASGEESRLS